MTQRDHHPTRRGILTVTAIMSLVVLNGATVAHAAVNCAASIGRDAGRYDRDRNQRE